MAKKKAVLNDQDFLDVILKEALSSADAIGNSSTDIRNMRIVQLAKDGISQRKIAEIMGVSHPTVGRVLKDAQRK